MYENEWSVGIAKYASKEHNVMIKFMHPKGLAKHYFWSQRDDKCWIPIQDILLKLFSPDTGSTARYYTFDPAQLIKDMLKNVNDDAHDKIGCHM